MKSSPKPESDPNAVLGIDPGLDRTGWALLERRTAAEPALRACGLIHTPAGRPLGERLESLYNELRGIMAGHRPDAVALEEMFFMKRAATVSATVQARGVIVLCARLERLPLASYDPRKVKVTLAGNGNASKFQMQRMVQLLMRLPEPLEPDDVADAVAVGICHLKLAPIAARMKAAENAIKLAMAK